MWDASFALLTTYKEIQIEVDKEIADLESRMGPGLN